MWPYFADYKILVAYILVLATHHSTLSGRENHSEYKKGTYINNVYVSKI